MEIKKTPKASLENKKVLFREIGLIAVLLIVLAGFEYKTYDKTVADIGDNSATFIEEENIPLTQETPPPPPEMPKPGNRDVRRCISVLRPAAPFQLIVADAPSGIP